MNTVLAIIICAAVGLLCGFIGGLICIILYTIHKDGLNQE